MRKIPSYILKRLIANESGSTVVIISLIFTALTVITALVVDVGIAYYRTAEVENAVDASALAAGQLLPVEVEDQSRIIEIKNRAVEYAVKNGINSLTTSNVELSNIIDGYYTQLDITIPETLKTTFAKVIGVNEFKITRNAKVELIPCKKVGDVVPLSITKTRLDLALQTNQTKHLALKFGGGDGDQGAYGAIDLDGVKSGGANDYSLWLLFGYTSSLSAGEQLYPVETGNMAGPTNTALIQRYNSCTHYQSEGGCTIDHYVSSCPRIIKTPVIEYDYKHDVKIRGFAAFMIEPFSAPGYVYGSFIKLVIPGVPSEEMLFGDALDYGLYNVKLIN